jgi:hypothetical protein
VLQLLLGTAVVLGFAVMSKWPALELGNSASAASTAELHPFCEMVAKGQQYQVCRNYCRNVLSTSYSRGADLLFCNCGQGQARVPLDCR